MVWLPSQTAHPKKGYGPLQLVSPFPTPPILRSFTQMQGSNAAMTSEVETPPLGSQPALEIVHQSLWFPPVGAG